MKPRNNLVYQICQSTSQNYEKVDTFIYLGSLAIQYNDIEDYVRDKISDGNRCLRNLNIKAYQKNKNHCLQNGYETYYTRCKRNDIEEKYKLI